MADPARAGLVALDDSDRHPTRDRCTALITDDLLDCDCGYVTTQMKIRLLAERDEHAGTQADPDE